MSQASGKGEKHVVEDRRRVREVGHKPRWGENAITAIRVSLSRSVDLRNAEYHAGVGSIFCDWLHLRRLGTMFDNISTLILP
jgi:hypothetical protein